jgi:hypothetical protein
MTISKEQAMAMFDHDLDGFMNEARGLMAHYRIGDWDAYLFFRKPDCAGSYVLKYEASAGDEFAKKIIALHTGQDRGEPERNADCDNPYCLDGYVDRERGNQDGTESWVEQVPCQLCNPEAEKP